MRAMAAFSSGSVASSSSFFWISEMAAVVASISGLKTAVTAASLLMMPATARVALFSVWPRQRSDSSNFCCWRAWLWRASSARPLVRVAEDRVISSTIRARPATGIHSLLRTDKFIQDSCTKTGLVITRASRAGSL